MTVQTLVVAKLRLSMQCDVVAQEVLNMVCRTDSISVSSAMATCTAGLVYTCTGFDCSTHVFVPVVLPCQWT